MKKSIVSILLLSCILTLNSCKKKEETSVTSSETAAPIDTTAASSSITTPSKGINWDEIPDLKDIGNFPFVTAPEGLKIDNEKDGLTELFPYETMEVYNGKDVISVEGKLGIIHISDAVKEGDDFNQKLFDKSFYDYFDKIGAKQLYKGDFPKDEKQSEQLGKNMWTGRSSTFGLMKESDAPFSVYVFKNNGKKYILNIQSNSAQGNIFIMELKDFEQTIKKYSAEQMKSDIDKTGKAILNINFDTDKATLMADGQKIVDEIYLLLNTNSNLKISIEGHTDNVGSSARNKELSTERANTVMYALAGKGIDIKRLKAIGFGSEKPIKANDTEENKAQNRRVELVKF
jgi:OmpA-OmpF porin, OOP family